EAVDGWRLRQSHRVNCFLRSDRDVCLFCCGSRSGCCRSESINIALFLWVRLCILIAEQDQEGRDIGGALFWLRRRCSNGWRCDSRRRCSNRLRCSKSRGFLFSHLGDSISPVHLASVNHWLVKVLAL